MAKPLAGKRAFEAMGRSDASRGLWVRARKGQAYWPQWARYAYARGVFNQSTTRIKS